VDDVAALKAAHAREHTRPHRGAKDFVGGGRDSTSTNPAIQDFFSAGFAGENQRLARTMESNIDCLQMTG